MKLNVAVIGVGGVAMVQGNHELKALLTRTDRFGEPYTMYQGDPGSGNLLIPRGLVHAELAQHDLRTTAFVPQLVAKKPPRNQDQAACIEQSVKLLKAGHDHILEAPTGFGKTYAGCSIANQMEQRTLIVVTKNDLIKGWKDTLTQLIGVDPAEIGHVQQDKQVYKGCRFVIAMVHSLVCREYDEDFYGYFGMVIFDEVHRLGADHFVEACKLFPAQYRLGLSATPDRSDGRQDLFHAHIGPVMVKGNWVPMSPKILVKKTGWKVPMVNRRIGGMWQKVPMPVEPAKMAPVNKAIGADIARNQEIATFVKSAYDAGRYTLILSDLIDDHLKPLFHYCVHAGIPGDDMGYYLGGMKTAELELTKKKRVVLATYQMVGEGTDVPHWDTLVMATPRANVKQPVGRVLRFLEGKKTPVVLDLVDNNQVLQNFFYSRLKTYYSLKSEVVEV